MTINRKSKDVRQRGRHTHGWGAMKKHRGAGNRGGVGRAGSGKRGDAKKPSYWKEKPGKHGFTSKKARLNALNVRELEQQLPELLQKKLAIQEADMIVIDLNTIGVDKLLGTGQVHQKLKVTVSAATKRAQQLINDAGGEVVLPNKKQQSADGTA